MLSTGRRPSVLPGLLLWLLQCSEHFRVAIAQIYDFEETPIPGNRSLQTVYAFYVYSEAEAPERIAPPFVKFAHLVAKAENPPSPATVTLETYKGVEVSIMRYRDFWSLIHPDKFCAGPEDVAAGLAKAADTLMVMKKPGQSFADVDMYIRTVPFNRPSEDKNFNIKSTGIYILVLSNCGDLNEATVSGNVIIKNSYGFLPGIEYHKLPFYGWLFLGYVILAIVWLALSLRWWKEVFNIQNCIAAVIFFGLVESFLWYIFYHDWNSSGRRGKIVFVLAIWSTVVKSCFSYMLVLVASLGWGVTRPFLDSQVIRKIQVMSFLYIVLDFIREAVFSFRHSHSLSLAFVLLCLLPVSLMNGAIFYWVFTALSNLILTLQERRQTEKLALFQTLWRILIIALSIATFSMLFQFFDVSRDNTSRWRYQWFFVDGIPHILFVFVLIAMMYLWAPHKYSQRYAYSQQINNDLEDSGKGNQAVWADDDILDGGDDDDGDSFWAATQAPDNTDVIGQAS
eukprot:TRINITY_DN25246_c0_g1_i1.p1 TRINITY_DN25246_c0_g1~~TRINITY_DN25246_c0_g1_i1.p1  ORF type:complete len:510 (+),score=110.88 TRINITY_DN25246_c0_g1_i1:132-1661(+)